tara:strand:+ start:315 stop:854 length:540 start_codon:yes stop_codon:yes gene_type:complete
MSLKGFDISAFKNSKPPKNSSLKTLKEIQELAKVKHDPGFVKKCDDQHKCFVDLARSKGIELDQEELNELIGQSADIVMKLKKHFNRPRPKVLAKEYNIPLVVVELKTMKTPSYPSGHSAQSRMLGRLYADRYKDNDFMLLANDISFSRNVAKCHYASDSRSGERLGDSMYKFIKSNAK